MLFGPPIPQLRPPPLLLKYLSRQQSGPGKEVHEHHLIHLCIRAYGAAAASFCIYLAIYAITVFLPRCRSRRARLCFLASSGCYCRHCQLSFKPNFMFLRPVTVKKIKIMCYPGRRGKYPGRRGKQSSLVSSTCLCCLRAQEEAQKLLKAVRLKWLLLGGETNQYSAQGFTSVCLKTLG